MKSLRTIKPKAFTLIELVVVMGAGSVVMMLAIGSVHQAMTLSSQSRQRADHQRVAVRLASEFRQDVHRAVKASVATQSVLLTMPDQSVVNYESNGYRVIRSVTREDVTTHQDIFKLRESYRSSLESIENPERVVLTVSTDIGKIERRIAAVLGRRLSHQLAEVSP